MKWVLCQTSSTLGDAAAHRKKILSLLKKHKDCDLLIFPELFLMGYPPEDTLELKFLIQKQEDELKKIKLTKKDPAVLFGACSLEKNRLYNSAVYLKGSSQIRIHKTHLAVSDTFDEMRFFSSGSPQKHIIKIGNQNGLILICEDLWKIQDLKLWIPKKKLIHFVICINASPFFPEQLMDRKKTAIALCRKIQAPLLYLNQAGSQDEWIFDGSSFMLNHKGELVFQAPSFKEHIAVIHTKNLKKIKTKKQKPALLLKKEAIQTGIYNFITRHGFQSIHLGLSGGLDSALTAVLCVEALGRQRVLAFYLEGPFSQKISRKLSCGLAKELKVKWKEFSITSSYQHILSLLPQLSPIAKENIQARLRALFLMSFSNSQNSLLIGTSNKSELSMGYSTLYGDLIGGFFPIGDLYKTEVTELARSYCSSKTMKEILKKPPSAELSLNQTDQRDLPPYEILDPILKNIIELRKKPKTSIEKNIFSSLLKNEFKRRQSPFVLKVSSKSFGRGRRYPITLK